MKKIVTLALTALMLLSCVTSFASFNDVTRDDWAYAEISAMESLGFIKGDANGNFNPSKALTLSDLKALPNWEGIIARPAAAEAIGERYLAFDDGASSDDARVFADMLAEKVGIAAVFSGNDADGYKYAVVSRTQDDREIGKALNTACNGRGGGKPDMVQGSVAATKEEIEKFWN